MSKPNNDELIKLRQKIDKLDQELVSLVAQRMKLVVKVGLYKKAKNIPPLDLVRWQQVVESRRKLATKYGLNSEFIEEVFDLLHEQALKLEEGV